MQPGGWKLTNGQRTKAGCDWPDRLKINENSFTIDQTDLNEQPIEDSENENGSPCRHVIRNRISRIVNRSHRSHSF